MSKEEMIKRGYAAKALLENQDFITATEAVRLQAYREWAGSSPEEGTKREQQYYLLQAVDRLTENLNALVANARMEEHKAKRDEKPSKPLTEGEENG